MNTTNNQTKLQTATFAGGCFWCIESAFAPLKGVVSAVSGLTGGTEPNPTYDSAHQKDTGHKEAVLVQYDPNIITYQELLDIFWMQIDPTDPDGQFADRGPLYQTAIFYEDSKQKEAAENSKQTLQKSGRFKKPIATQILPASEFFPADEYTQGFWRKYPERYKLYKIGSGRQQFIDAYWKHKQNSDHL